MSIGIEAEKAEEKANDKESKDDEPHFCLWFDDSDARFTCPLGVQYTIETSIVRGR